MVIGDPVSERRCAALLLAISDGAMFGGTTARPTQTLPGARMRERAYKFAIGLSAICAADILLLAGLQFDSRPYAGMGYAYWFFFPVFLPAVLVALVIIGIYAYGFAWQSWRPRRAEWAFFVLFALAVAAHIGLIIWG